MEQARSPDVSDVEFRRELSLIAGSSVDPEIIIRVHSFESDVVQTPVIDLARFPDVPEIVGDDFARMDTSAVLWALRDINSFLEERSRD